MSYAPIAKTQTVLVEPNVPMDHLVQATLAAGLVPLVVMEFPGVTAGEGFSGTSGESSSFRHGFFDATINWIEIVLPNGEVRIASKNTHPDLFWGAASAFGTLGVVTLLEVQCQQAKPYVELKYQSTSHMDSAMDIFPHSGCRSADRLPRRDRLRRGSDRRLYRTADRLSACKHQTATLHRLSGSLVLSPCTETCQLIFRKTRLHPLDRLPFPLRPGRVLGCPVRLFVLPSSIQPYHTLHSRLFHAHAGDVPRPPRERTLQAVHHPRRGGPIRRDNQVPRLAGPETELRRIPHLAVPPAAFRGPDVTY